MKIRAIFEITLSSQDQGLAKRPLGLDITLPCESRDIVLKLENGVKPTETEDAEGGR